MDAKAPKNEKNGGKGTTVIRLHVDKEYTIGRSRRCVIVIRGDKKVSGVHCRIAPGGWLTDEGSSRGTKINGEPVDPMSSDGVMLLANDIIKVGDTNLKVTFHSDTSPPPPKESKTDTKEGKLVAENPQNDSTESQSPGLGSEEPSLDAGDQGLAAGKPGIEAGEPGLEAGEPGLEAGKPGLKEGEPGLESGEPGLEGGEPELDLKESPVEARREASGDSVGSGSEHLWIQYMDEERGVPYFHNAKTNETTWEAPKHYLVHPSAVDYVQAGAGDQNQTKPTKKPSRPKTNPKNPKNKPKIQKNHPKNQKSKPRNQKSNLKNHKSENGTGPQVKPSDGPKPHKSEKSGSQVGEDKKSEAKATFESWADDEPKPKPNNKPSNEPSNKPSNKPSSKPSNKPSKSKGGGVRPVLPRRMMNRWQRVELAPGEHAPVRDRRKMERVLLHAIGVRRKKEPKPEPGQDAWD
uniref:FHA domain-containing protein n=1 Tax=Amorphochlora amoebiformis TaxID=1561963 RepID=A0A7S0DEU5_9EUKA